METPTATPLAGLPVEARPTPPTLGQMKGCDDVGPKVCLVAVGVVPTEWMEGWAAHLREQYGIDVRVLPAVDPLDAWIPDRRKLSIEGAVDLVTRDYPRASTSPGTVVLAVTPVESVSRDGRDAVGYVYMERLALYSIPALARGAPGDAITRGRVQKVLARSAGSLYFKLPWSDSADSLMYRNLTVALIDQLPATLPSGTRAQPDD